MTTVAFLSHPDVALHDTGPHHPERPDRIRAIHRAVREAGMIDSPDPFPDFDINLGPLDGGGVKLLEVQAGPADPKWTLLVHPEEHLRRVQHVCEIGGVLDQGDTPVSHHSFDAAMLSLGGVLQGCDMVMSGQANRAFSAGRPPGHHAEPDRAMGFCLFSNIAIAACYLQRQHQIRRVAIVDFDVHHGNGTQAAFEDDPSVYFVSMHQHPRTCYPGTGYEWEIGVGLGRGTTMNIPFRPGSGDLDYLAVLRDKVLPALDLFGPEALLISAGFDAHMDDPLAQMDLSEAGFETMTRELATFADRRCGGRCVSVLEGGYNLRALGRSVVRHLVAFAQSLR